MSGLSSLFSFQVEATAPSGSEAYRGGKRYDLIVFVREHSMDGAKLAARELIAQAGWEFPEVKEAMLVSGKMRLDKLSSLDLEQAVRTAVKQGGSTVVFNERPIR